MGQVLWSELALLLYFILSAASVHRHSSEKSEAAAATVQHKKTLFLSVDGYELKRFEPYFQALTGNRTIASSCDDNLICSPSTSCLQQFDAVLATTVDLTLSPDLTLHLRRNGQSCLDQVAEFIEFDKVIVLVLNPLKVLAAEIRDIADLSTQQMQSLATRMSTEWDRVIGPILHSDMWRDNVLTVSMLDMQSDKRLALKDLQIKEFLGRSTHKGRANYDHAGHSWSSNSSKALLAPVVSESPMSPMRRTVGRKLHRKLVEHEVFCEITDLLAPMLLSFGYENHTLRQKCTDAFREKWKRRRRALTGTPLDSVLAMHLRSQFTVKESDRLHVLSLLTVAESGISRLAEASNSSQADVCSKRFNKRRYLEIRSQSAAWRDVPLLLSYPGSGNTWMRLLVETMTGIYTGSVYNDFTLRPAFPGEDRCDPSVVVIKAHPFSVVLGQLKGYSAYLELPLSDVLARNKCRLTGNLFTRAVLVVRDPFHAIYAEFQRRATSRHDGHANEAFIRKYFAMFAIQEAETYWQGWSEKLMPFLRNANSRYVVLRYEDMVSANSSSKILSAWRLLQFLNVSFDAERVLCAFNASGNSTVHRTKGVDIHSAYQWMPRELVCQMWSRLRSFSFYFGYSIWGNRACT